ncbi:hypothetical protein LTR10_007610 [Elasticomyces elasticus]|nr:hypothetical protein LTR10_007610 [Elasticomyces elasticus]KAK4970614.1 hypothetical protein LTR42_007589 [Elasticomyces elasticus]
MAEQGATPDEAPTSAVAKVFGIPELLELILLHTIDGQQVVTRYSNPGRKPIRSASLERLQQLRALLVNQRVARTFEAVITSSRNLREALFFTHERCDSNGQYNSNFAINKLVASPRFYCKPQPDSAWTYLTWACAGAQAGTIRMTEDNNPLPGDSVAEFAERSSVGSWRKMLLVSQPMQLQVKTCASTGSGKTIEKSWDCGTTVGQLLGDSSLLPHYSCLNMIRCTCDVRTKEPLR